MMKYKQAILQASILFLFPALASAATLSLSPSSQSVTVGQNFTVNVLLNAQGQAVDGVDISYLRYNPSLLQVQSATAGTLMPLTLSNNFATQGQIQFSQVASGGSSYTGQGTLLTIAFKALSQGTANVTFDFTSGNTQDTNVSGASTDLLTSVTNGSYVIQASSTPTPTPTPTPAPSAGTIKIGEPNILSTDDSNNGDLLVAQQTTLSQTATIQSLSFYVTTAAGQLRLGIYDSAGPGGGPGQKKAETNSFTPTTGWNTANVITPVSLPTGTYWLAYLPSSSSLAFVDDYTGSAKWYSYTFGSMPQTFSTSPTGGYAVHWSFYATLNTSGVVPPSTKFSINDRVQVNATFVNVRATANGTLLGTQTTNALGTVIGGPTNTGGYNWWNINFDTGFDGWSAEDYLVKYTILSPLDFTLSNGGNKSVTQGSSGTTQSTGFAVSGLPTGATASFSPTACSPNCSTTLTISTSASTPAGNSTIIVTVTAGSVTKTSTFTLTVNAPTTTSGALLQKSDLVYQGSFKVPHGTFGASSFDWGEGIMAYNPANNSLFISSHPYQNSVAEISIPTVVNSSSLAALNTASVLQNFSEISEGRKNQIPCIGTHFIGGLLPRGSSLLVSYYNFYDGGTCQQQSHFVSGQTLSTGGDVTGPWAANYAVTPSTNNAGYVHGWMIPVPSAYQSSLGGSAILGNCCLSIVGRTSQGPSVFSFNPSTVGANNPFPITPLLYYSPEHPSLGQWNQTSPTFNGTTQIKGAAMIDGTRSLLFFGRQGTGTYCYGPGAQCGDPVNANQGDHAYPYVSQIWAYDVNDLIASKHGQISPWNVMPYSVWTYTTPFQRANNGKPGGVAWDPNTRRLFVVEQFGDSDWPVITVWQVSGSGTTNPVPTVSLTASPTSITSGTASTLTWSSTNVTSCTASGAWSGTKSTSGSQSTGNLTANSTFTLSCTGTGGTTNQSVSVNVTAPIAFNFTLSN